MISYLNGIIKSKTAIPKKDNFLVLDVKGVGYKVYVPDKIINKAQVGVEMELFIYTQVAETALNLFGFDAQDELDFFELLLSISGIGPKGALNVLQKAKTSDLKTAISSGNADLLNQVSGIGPKTAQKIVAGLQDKIGSIDGYTDVSSEFGEALEALTGLGYSVSQARDALSHSQATDTGEKIKEALKILGKK